MPQYHVTDPASGRSATLTGASEPTERELDEIFAHVNGAAPAAGNAARDATLAQRIRAKHPGAYDDLSDQDLEAKVLAKHPEYADLPRTPTHAPGLQDLVALMVAGGESERDIADVIRHVTQRSSAPAVGSDVSHLIPGAAPAAGGLTVHAPNGRAYVFTNQAQADAFRRRAGVR